MNEDIVKRTEFENHLREDFRKAHDIWPNLKYGIPTFTESISELSHTGDANWYDVTVSGASTGADKKIMVLLTVYEALGTGSYYFYTRKNGSSANFEGAFKAKDDATATIFQLCDSNATYEYKTNTAKSSSFFITQLGYFTFPT